MNPLDLIQAAKTRRAAAGLVANNGIHCPTQAWVTFYNFRDSIVSRDPETTAKLIRLNKLAKESIK